VLLSPPLHVAIARAVEDAGAQMHEAVDTAPRPLPLLRLGGALGDHLIDGGLDERSRGRLAVVAALGIVRDQPGVVRDIATELVEVALELPDLAEEARERRRDPR
jgi:hypothetical protein